MAKFIFKLEEDGVREASSIEFKVPDDMNITEFKIVCVRMAHSLGYSPNSIDKVFGPIETHKTKEESFRRFIREFTTSHQLSGSIV